MTTTKYECRQFDGAMVTVEVVGEIIVSCPGRCIYVAEDEGRFYVYYGLQKKGAATIEEAISEFETCFLHSVECEGDE